MPGATTVTSSTKPKFFRWSMRCLVFASGQTIAPPSKVLNTLVAWKLSTDRSPCRRRCRPCVPHAEGVRGVVDDLEVVVVGDPWIASTSHGCAVAVHRHDGGGLRRDGRLDLRRDRGCSVSGSMSTNTGLMPFHSSECAVATNEYGVVITSPVMRSACSAVTSAIVPLANSDEVLDAEVVGTAPLRAAGGTGRRWSGSCCPRSSPDRA